MCDACEHLETKFTGKIWLWPVPNLFIFELNWVKLAWIMQKSTQWSVHSSPWPLMKHLKCSIQSLFVTCDWTLSQNGTVACKTVCQKTGIQQTFCIICTKGYSSRSSGQDCTRGGFFVMMLKSKKRENWGKMMKVRYLYGYSPRDKIISWRNQTFWE